MNTLITLLALTLAVSLLGVTVVTIQQQQALAFLQQSQQVCSGISNCHST
jgi:hypothetical protein